MRKKQMTRRDIMLAAILAFAIGVIVGLLICRSTDFFGHHDDGAGPGAGGNGGKGGHSGVGGVHGSSSIIITGDTEGLLLPGSTLPLDVSLDNTIDFDLVVRNLTVSVSAVHAPQSTTNRPCSPADFEVSPLSKSVEFTLEASTESSLSGLGVAQADWPTVGMINSPVINQNGCKGATLTLDYDASGTEVAR